LGYLTGLRCRSCGRDYPAVPLNACDLCFGPLETTYDYKAISKVLTRKRIQNGPLTIWRYQDLLPADGTDPIDLSTGFTPLIKARNLGRLLGLNELYLKNDAVNPSYSFKDRVVSVAATKAREFEFDTLACASTGNLGGSVAAHAARAGMASYIFFPADLEHGKMVGAAVYKPTLVAVNGSYDQVNRLCSELADSYPWAFVNINMRPYYSEGSKTLGYEVAEQLGWKAPNHCIIPAASGSLYTKIWKGFHELASLDLIPPVHTEMHLTQPAGCSPIATAHEEGLDQVRPIKPDTLAKSLAIGNPADGFYALQVIQASKGTATIVPEEEIAEGIEYLAQTEGIFTETAGGVAVSALRRLVQRGVIKADETTVLYVTGNGLKTVEVVQSVVHPLNISPTMTSFQQSIKSE